MLFFSLLLQPSREWKRVIYVLISLNPFFHSNPLFLFFCFYTSFLFILFFRLNPIPLCLKFFFLDHLSLCIVHFRVIVCLSASQSDSVCLLSRVLLRVRRKSSLRSVRE